MAARVRVRVPATTANLGPGFDALGMALALFNRFEVERLPEGCYVEAHGQSADLIPQGEDNLVVRAARAVWERAGLEPAGWRVRLWTEIPLGCGLGSSASAIVGGVVAANVLAGEPLGTDELLAIAAGLEGHADNVTAAMLGGFTVATHRPGEAVRWERVEVRGVRAVVAVPDVVLPTERSRRVLPKAVSLADAVFNVGRASLLVAAMAVGDRAGIAAGLDDRLHQPYRASLVPGFGSVVAAAKGAGALGAVLSGAGPSVLALIPEPMNAEPVGEAMVGAFRDAGVTARWLALSPDHGGVAVEQIDALDGHRAAGREVL
ncbi:MAG: homoserine kinase [Firmicutes bacterium]|nr:homoserine kinase [Bacillota bacterium]